MTIANSSLMGNSLEEDFTLVGFGVDVATIGRFFGVEVVNWSFGISAKSSNSHLSGFGRDGRCFGDDRRSKDRLFGSFSTFSTDIFDFRSCLVRLLVIILVRKSRADLLSNFFLFNRASCLILSKLVEISVHFRRCWKYLSTTFRGRLMIIPS